MTIGNNGKNVDLSRIRLEFDRIWAIIETCKADLAAVKYGQIQDLLENAIGNDGNEKPWTDLLLDLSNINHLRRRSPYVAIDVRAAAERYVWDWLFLEEGQDRDWATKWKADLRLALMPFLTELAKLRTGWDQKHTKSGDLLHGVKVDIILEIAEALGMPQEWAKPKASAQESKSEAS